MIARNMSLKSEYRRRYDETALGQFRNGEKSMNPTRQLHALGQSLWLDNITRDLLNSGTLQRYCNELSVSGLTSNPTIPTLRNG